MSANSLPVRKASPSGEGAAIWHSLEFEEALDLLDSNADSGLTPEEVQARLQKYGPNELEESGGRSAWEILLESVQEHYVIDADWRRPDFWIFRLLGNARG